MNEKVKNNLRIVALGRARMLTNVDIAKLIKVKPYHVSQYYYPKLKAMTEEEVMDLIVDDNFINKKIREKLSGAEK